jgi:hypothetical protein
MWLRVAGADVVVRDENPLSALQEVADKLLVALGGGEKHIGRRLDPSLSGAQSRALTELWAALVGRDARFFPTLWLTPDLRGAEEFLDGVLKATGAEGGSASLNPAALIDVDRSILEVLRRTNRPLTNQELIAESVRLHSQDRSIVRLAERTMRPRIQILLDKGLVARPPRTKRKGIFITSEGLRQIEACAGKLPETHR